MKNDHFFRVLFQQPSSSSVPQSKSYNLSYNTKPSGNDSQQQQRGSIGTASSFNVLDVVSTMNKSLAKEDPKNKIDVRAREKQKELERERLRKMGKQPQQRRRVYFNQQKDLSNTPVSYFTFRLLRRTATFPACRVLAAGADPRPRPPETGPSRTRRKLKSFSVFASRTSPTAGSSRRSPHSKRRTLRCVNFMPKIKFLFFPSSFIFCAK